MLIESAKTATAVATQQPLLMSKRAFEQGSGWQIKPEGACKGDVCIPLSDAAGDELDVRSIAADLGLPLVGSAEHGLWALGPEAIESRALTTVAAPSLVLPDKDGKPFDLASLRGQKVLVYAWAPY